MRDQVFINFIEKDYAPLKNEMQGYMRRIDPAMFETQLKAQCLERILSRWIPGFRWLFQRELTAVLNERYGSEGDKAHTV